MVSGPSGLVAHSDKWQQDREDIKQFGVFHVKAFLTSAI